MNGMRWPPPGWLGRLATHAVRRWRPPGLASPSVLAVGPMLRQQALRGYHSASTIPPLSDRRMSDRPRLIRDATFLEAGRDERSHLRRGRPAQSEASRTRSTVVRVLGSVPLQQAAPGNRRGDPEVRRPCEVWGPTGRDDPRLRAPAADGLRASSSASVSTCVCARSTPPPANGWRGSSKTKRCGSTARRPCWRGRGAGSATNTVLAPADSVLRRAVGAARHQGPRPADATHGRAACRRRCATASTSWSPSATTSRIRRCTASRPARRARRSVA